MIKRDPSVLLGFTAMVEHAQKMARRLSGAAAGVGMFDVMSIRRARKRGRKARQQTGRPWKDGPKGRR